MSVASIKIQWQQVAIGVAAVAVLAWAAITVAHSQTVAWSEIPRYLVDRRILNGVVLTLELTAAAMAFGIVTGGVLAAFATSRNFVLKAIAAAFVWWFRGVPLIVQVFFWFNIALFVPQIGLGAHVISINDLVTPTIAGFLALGLHETAHMSEIIRGGLNAVEKGQREAALSLGLKPVQTLRAVILPQAIRLVIPPTGNETIGMLKASAIVSVIGMHDLLTQAQQIYAANFLVIELLIVASIWYLAITTVASIGQYFLERRFAPGKRGP